MDGPNLVILFASASSKGTAPFTVLSGPGHGLIKTPFASRCHAAPDWSRAVRRQGRQVQRSSGSSFPFQSLLTFSIGATQTTNCSPAPHLKLLTATFRHVGLNYQRVSQRSVRVWFLCRGDGSIIMREGLFLCLCVFAG